MEEHPLNRNVYLYWNGPTYSLLRILRNLIYLHSKSGKGYNVHILTPENVQEYVKDLPEYFLRLNYAHQADYVRVVVLCERGGIWLDSDTIVMGSLDSLFDILEKKDGFFVSHHHTGGGICNGFFGTRPHTRIMKYWKKRIEQILSVHKEHIRWSQIGSSILNTVDPARNFYKKYTILNGPDTVYPINFDKCESEFLDKPYAQYTSIVRKYQPLVILTNPVYKRLELESEDTILASNRPLNYFLNESLKRAEEQSSHV